MLQIHIGGTKRSGKSTLARYLGLRLAPFHAVVRDVDDIRRSIFQQSDVAAKIGSPENQQFHSWAYNALFELVVPVVLEAGGTPIVTATHSRIECYYLALRLAKQYGARLKYILLEAPPWEEVVRRASCDRLSLSDTNDLSGDDEQIKAYRESAARFEQSYSNFQEPHLRIAQADIGTMVAKATEYICSP